MAIQQLMLGVGAIKKTYADDVFSTYLYKGNSGGGNSNATQTITNGIDLATEGGLVWFKRRLHATDHYLVDTERGTTKYIKTNNDNTEATDSDSLTSFNTNGFTLGDDPSVNADTDFTSWTFRKSKGFFDVVTWTGAGETYKNISHNLGSVPGCIIVKKTSGGSGDWLVFHRDLNNGTNSWQYRVSLNNTWAEASAGQSFLYSAPTATQFQIGDWFTNNGTNYVAYVFAGGESTAATARSVEFDGSDDYLSIPDNDAWDISSSDATIECWVNFDSHNGHDGIIHNFHSTGLPGNGTSGWALEPVGKKFSFYWGTTAGGYGNVEGEEIPLGQWQHLAVTKSGSTITLYQNGVKTKSGTISGTMNPGVTPLRIGGDCVGEFCDCHISNVRLTKGQVLYTSSFKPPTEPLTTTSQGATASNVKLLCCNNSSATGSTVTPDTITSNNNGAIADTDSPFDDPAAFTFGDAGDQNVIKTGSYVGNGSSTGPKIDLGWEPQWILIKNITDANSYWMIFDSMRGIVSGGNSFALYSNGNDAEDTATNYIDLTSTGFKATIGSNTEVNKDGSTYIFTAIRRPDGYIGKPADAGTDVFTMDTGNASTTIPSMDSGFPVDFAFVKTVGSNTSWNASARLISEKFIKTDTTSAEDTSTGYPFDSNVGWGAADWLSSSVQSWMWKRHKGFDVVCYEGNSNNTDGANVHKHSLGKAPEMIWIKARSGGTYSGVTHWSMSHKGLNGGTNPWQYTMQLNLSDAEAATSNFGNTAPTSEVFYVGEPGNARTNHTSTQYIAFLFASVDGISKVGYYTGNGSGQTITTGFQPRFIIIKRTQYTQSWMVLDTTRGWGSGSDNYLQINDSVAQASHDFGAPTSTGFTLTASGDSYNSSSENYIYYAHA